ncbi:unnamed protein product, partial [Schistosoma turkestanicum]
MSHSNNLHQTSSSRKINQSSPNADKLTTVRHQATSIQTPTCTVSYDDEAGDDDIEKRCLNQS